MSVKFFIGRYKPKHNVRCQITGRAFGPSHPRKKVGHQLTADFGNGKKMSYTLWSQKEALELRETIDKEHNENEGLEEV